MLTDASRWITHPEWSVPPDELDAPPVLEVGFDLDEAVEAAELEIAAVGVWVAHINGRPVDDAVLRPAMSEYTRRIESAAVDVSSLLAVGRNTLTVQLGEGPAHVREAAGRYSKFIGSKVAPRARAELHVSLANGDTRTIVSDPSWKAFLGPTRLSHWFGGEEYDARQEPKGWLTCEGARPSDVTSAAVVDVSADLLLWNRVSPPVRVVDRLTAPALHQAGPGVLIADFGRNIAGRQVLVLAENTPSDVRIEMWPSEYLGKDGRVDQTTTGSPIFDVYTTSGGRATWSPQFLYHGMRYLELRVTDVEGAPLDDTERWLTVSAVQLMTDNTEVGTFSSSDPVLDGIHQLVRRAVQSNMFSVPTDCPHREKLGWLEQTHLVFRPIARMYDIEEHWAELVTHMGDAQLPSGLIPDIAPELVVFDFDPAEHQWPFNPKGFRDDVNWGSAILHIPLQLFQTYGTLGPARDAWPIAQRYLAFLEEQADGRLLSSGLADWITLDHSTPASLVAGYGHIRALDAATKLAQLLDDGEAAARYSAAAQRVRELLRTAHVHVENGSEFGSGSQGSIALLLHAGILSDDERARAIDELVRVVRNADEAITVGEIALPALVDVLLDHGQAELWYRMATNLRHPSYGSMVAAGLTSLAESWKGADSGISANHFMLGYVDTWIVEHIAGLRQADGSVGWEHAVVQPHPVAEVSSAATSYVSVRGRYSVGWTLEGDKLTVLSEVPESGSATVVAPPGFALATSIPVEVGPGSHRHLFRRRH